MNIAPGQRYALHARGGEIVAEWEVLDPKDYFALFPPPSNSVLMRCLSSVGPPQAEPVGEISLFSKLHLEDGGAFTLVDQIVP